MGVMVGDFEVPQHRQDAMIVEKNPGITRILNHRLQRIYSKADMRKLHQKGNEHKLKMAHKQARRMALWEPTERQLIAYNSVADQLLVGGAVGGGKTGLCIGMALTKGKRVLILRQNAVEIEKGIIQDLRNFTNNTDKLNIGDKRWEFVGTDLLICWSGLATKQDKDGIQGTPWDLIIIDEAALLYGPWARFIMAWNRTTDWDQKCQVLMTCNPPENHEGMWVQEDFAPWVSKDYEGERAEPGEIRYYLPDLTKEEGGGVECGPDDSYKTVLDGEEIKVEPLRRTFVPMLLNHNPYVDKQSYLRTLGLQGGKKYKRLVEGNWNVVVDDQFEQVIPSTWIKAAQDRWTRYGFEDEDMHHPFPVCQSNVGVDPARGGNDTAAICERWGYWFSEIKEVPTDRCRDGDVLASDIMLYRKSEETPIAIDADGIGSSPYDSLCRRIGKQWVLGTISNTKTKQKTRGIRIQGFSNLRSLMWWRMREILDPKNQSRAALPPSDRLAKELAMPTYETVSGKIVVESKKKIKQRLNGNSTDYADAVIHANFGLGMKWPKRIQDLVRENRVDIYNPNRQHRPSGAYTRVKRKYGTKNRRSWMGR